MLTHHTAPGLLVLLLAALLLLPATAARAAENHPIQYVSLTPTPIPLGYGPDRCEPNNSLVQPCAVPNEIDITDLTFVDDLTDVFSALLKGNRTYTIRASSTSGIDPQLTVYLAGSTEQPIAQNDDLAAGSGDAAVQIHTPADGWYLIQVDNQAVGTMRGRTYTLSVRSSAATNGTTAMGATTTPTSTAIGDAFENNYSVVSAPKLAWGVPYDLSMICPDSRPGACVSGDHDFFLVPVKKGVLLAALTYDLGPGADTTIALYRPAPGITDLGTGIPGWQLLQGNDDALSGRTLRSQILLTPDWNGEALIIVAPSDRADPPRLPEAAGSPARYRLIVGSPFLPAVQQVLQAQQEAASSGAPAGSGNSAAVPVPTTSAPAATVLPTAQQPAGDAEEIIRETCLIGLARVVNDDGARFSAAAVPSSASRYLMIYPKGSEVALLGSCYLGWVKVRPTMAVSPGWMYAPDLELVEVTSSAPNGANQPNATADPLVVQPTVPPLDVGLPANAQPTTRPMQIVILPTRTLPQPTALPRQALTVAVQVLDEKDTPRAGVRVQLVDVLGSVLREGPTDNQGRITLVADLPASAAVWVAVPAAGLTAPIDRAKPALTLVIPGSE